LLIAWFLCGTVGADTFPACVERVYAEGVTAKQAWHVSLRDLTAQMRPDLSTLATLDMNQQLALMERRRAQFRYLVQVDPTRIHTREGLSAFQNFEWTDADARNMRQRSPSYVGLEAKITELARQTSGQADWHILQEYARTAVVISPRFQDALHRLQARESVVERHLQGCPSPR
jgi:hypothetical protein